MKILLGDFDANVVRENIFKPTIRNESLHQDSNDNGARIVNFITSKNLVVKSMTFPHRNIHKYTWTSPDGKNHNQIGHILIDRKWHSNILDVWLFRGADSHTEHYLVVEEVKKILAVSRRAARKFDKERFNLRKLNKLEVMKQYQIKISSSFAAFENLSVSKNIYRA